MKKLAILSVLVLQTCGVSAAGDLRVGSIAPEFSAASSDGHSVSLKELLGKGPIVLYFYGADETPESIREATAFRDAFGAYSDLKATIFGISYDSLASHRKFIAAHWIPFRLLSDLDHNISRAYGCAGFLGAKVQTFIIDKHGTLIYINRDVKLRTQAVEIQNFLSQL